MSTYCTLEIECRLIRIDQSSRRLSLRCTRCNSRMHGFIRISHLSSERPPHARSRRSRSQARLCRGARAGLAPRNIYKGSTFARHAGAGANNNPATRTETGINFAAARQAPATRRLYRCRRIRGAILYCGCARRSASGQVGTKGWSVSIREETRLTTLLGLPLPHSLPPQGADS
jgi:hypothetical protein